jgi:hypothetical protein
MPAAPFALDGDQNHVVDPEQHGNLVGCDVEMIGVGEVRLSPAVTN